MYASTDALDWDAEFEPTLWTEEIAALPRCYILNEKHRVILACSPRPGDPLNGRFVPSAHANALPPLVERAIRILEDTCEADGSASKSTTVGRIRLSVKPLRGPWGTHTTLVVEAAEPYAEIALVSSSNGTARENAQPCA